ncbi:MAG: UV DNA damage repair endonuclease UvsE [Geobacteraceae bacterium]|nr:UV DNA damage repair endonuclease UvsE [Geobacteraceae bacterium]NTW81395.1 UV DNA damage repair endonuclease UvsE [Geobacteraceae bacterium]
MLRFGLCCLFKNEDVSFRTTTVKALLNLTRDRQLFKLSEICLHNARNLQLALEAAHRLGIGAFRIMSPLFPRMTHPEAGYSLDHLPDGDIIYSTLETCRSFADRQQIRLSFHPDQFVVLSSPHPAVVANSIQELEYQARLAEAVGADVINIHAGGVYGDKLAALKRFGNVYDYLPESVRSRLTLENDDISYTPEDLLQFCEQRGIPFVYDVHHHRCNPDNMTIEEATERAGITWKVTGLEQQCHISSPKAGWGSGIPRPHADYIDPSDVPDCWLGRQMTVDVEAKAKELAVVRLINDIRKLNTN